MTTAKPIRAATVRERLHQAPSEDEQSAEIEAAHEAKAVTFVAVPNELLPDVQALLARRRSA